jgi:hypothetical protein
MPRHLLRRVLFLAVAGMLFAVLALAAWDHYTAPARRLHRDLQAQVEVTTLLVAEQDNLLRDLPHVVEKVGTLEAAMAACPRAQPLPGATGLPGGQPPSAEGRFEVASGSSDGGEELLAKLEEHCALARVTGISRRGAQVTVTWALEPPPPSRAPDLSGGVLAEQALPAGAWLQPGLTAEARALQAKLREARSRLRPEFFESREVRARFQQLLHWMERTREANALAMQALEVLAQAPPLELEVQVQRYVLPTDLPTVDALRLLATAPAWQLLAPAPPSTGALAARLKSRGFEVHQVSGEATPQLLALKRRPPFTPALQGQAGKHR